MSTTDESENLPEQLSERIDARGWRVISNSALQPEREASELKTLIQVMQGRLRVLGRRKIDETDPPEAA